MSVRLAVEADVPQMLAIYRPYVEQTTYSFEYTAPTCAEFSARFAHHTAQFPWLVWEEQGQLLGYAYASAPFSRAAYSWCAEVSVYLHPSAHRRGIGRTLYAVLEQILFRQGYRVIYSLITTDNAPSLAFHRALGYRTVAQMPDCGIKFGRSLGIVYMEKRCPSTVLPDSFPVPYFNIVNNTIIEQDILGNLSLS